MSPQNHYAGLARALTLDHAFSRAYGELRHRLLAVCEAEPDMRRKTQILDAMDIIAEVLEHDLQGICYGPEMAAQLARPV